MRLKKLTASILAAALALTAVPLTVSAQSGETAKEQTLVTAALSEIHGATGISYVGRGVYFYYKDGSVAGAVHISDQELKEWKETGKLGFTDINTDSAFADNSVRYNWYNDCTFEDGDYMTLNTKDEDNNVLSRFAVKYNEKTNTIEKVRDLEVLYTHSYEQNVRYNGALITHKGYTISASQDNENSKFTIKGFGPDGNEAFSNTYDGIILSGTDIVDYHLCINAKSDKYCCYFAAVTEDNETEDEGRVSGNYKNTIFAIDYNGNTEEIYSVLRRHPSQHYYPIFNLVDKDSFSITFEGALNGVEGFCFYNGENIVCYNITAEKNENANDKSLQDSETGEYFDNVVSPEYTEGGVTGLAPCVGFADMNGNAAVGVYNFGKIYALIDTAKNELLSDSYASISKSCDNGATYLVKTSDGKGGYIDENGKELGLFDDAAAFYGDYAPVIVDGRAYIIDKNMKYVSEGIEAEGVSSLNKDIQSAKVENGYLLINTSFEMTETEPPVTEPDTTSPEESDPEITSEPEESSATETEKSNTFTDSSEDKAAEIVITAKESVIPSNAVLSVRKNTASSTDTRIAYDITFTVDGKEYQPDGKVTVSIPVPEAFKDTADRLAVYHEVNGCYKNMNAALKDGYLVFETDHFSTYIVTAEDLDPDQSAPTGVTVAIVPAAALAALAVIFKKRK